MYAQVDSYNPSTSYGTVLETHEMVGGAYNNIRGPVASSSALTEASPLGHPTDPGRYVVVSEAERIYDALPSRP